MAVAKVWIEGECTICNACESACPEVFHVTDETCFIKGSTRQDGLDDENLEAQSPLLAEFTDLDDEIEEAAEGCPVEIIKFELVEE